MFIEQEKSKYVFSEPTRAERSSSSRKDFYLILTIFCDQEMHND